jgi:hypothetical protein
MNEWHDFFLAQAAATATLTGLVFVGVSINLQTIVSDPCSGLAGRAGQALILLVAVLTVSVLLLVPGQGPGIIGAEILVVGLVCWGWVVAIQLPRLGSHEARTARALRVSGGAGTDRHAATDRRGRRRAFDGVRWALLAGGWHALLDLRGFVRRVGIARRDQPLGASRSFRPSSYAP